MRPLAAQALQFDTRNLSPRPLQFFELPVKARDVLRRIDRMNPIERAAVTVSVSKNLHQTLCLPNGWTVVDSSLIPPAGQHPEYAIPAARLRWLCQSLIREGGRDVILMDRSTEHPSKENGEDEKDEESKKEPKKQTQGNTEATEQKTRQPNEDGRGAVGSDPSSDSSTPSQASFDSHAAAELEAERKAELEAEREALLVALEVAGNPEPSHTAYHGFGGFVGNLPPAQRRLVGSIRAVLRRWIADGSEDDDGPRIDWSRGIVRLQTYRSPQPTRRQERGRPSLAVLLDHSGSCAGVFQHAAPLAAALGILGIAGADVDVFVHSNGWLHQHWRNGRLLEFVPNDEYDTNRSLIPTDIPSDTQYIVALGDWDAADLYAVLADRPTTRQFIWLDGWRGSTSHGPVLAPDQITRAEGWTRSAQRKTRYVAGMHTADDWMAGLRLGLGF